MTEVTQNNCPITSEIEILKSFQPVPFKEKTTLKIGLEDETLFHNLDLSLMTPDQSQAVMREMTKNSTGVTYEDRKGHIYDHKPDVPAIITVVENDKAAISLEASGVLENALKPVHIGQEADLLNELKKQKAELYSVTDDMGLIPCPYSASPVTRWDQVEENLVDRQRLINCHQFFKDNHSPAGIITLGLVTSSQISIEADTDNFDQQMRFAFLLQPLLYSLCSSHSGFSQGQKHDRLIRPDSYLAHNDVGRKANRAGIPDCVFDYSKPVVDGYAEAVMNSPMYFCYTQDGEILYHQPTFRELQRDTPELATMTNLNAARSLVFYDVKLHDTPNGSGKRLEMRSPDSGPGNAEMALLITSACLGDGSRLRDTELAFKESGLFVDHEWDKKNVQAARLNVAGTKLATQFGTKTLSHFSKVVNEIVTERFKHDPGLDEAVETLNMVTQTGLTNTAYAQQYLSTKDKVINYMGTEMARSGVSPVKLVA